jgi:phosphoribosylanthranilate isomerase
MKKGGLGQFMQAIAQTMGPEAIQQFINPDELIKRLAASKGIEILNLVKSKEELQQEMQAQQQVQQQQSLVDQTGQMMNSPAMDPANMQEQQ